MVARVFAGCRPPRRRFFEVDSNVIGEHASKNSESSFLEAGGVPVGIAKIGSHILGSPQNRYGVFAFRMVPSLGLAPLESTKDINKFQE